MIRPSNRDAEGAAPRQDHPDDKPDGHRALIRDTDGILDEVRDLQSALLAVLEADLMPEDKSEAAGRVLARAHKAAAPEIALPALEWVEQRHHEQLMEPEAAYGDPAERRVLELRRRGHESCPGCLLPLPERSTIERWQRERILAALWRDRLHDRLDRRSA